MQFPALATPPTTILALQLPLLRMASSAAPEKALRLRPAYVHAFQRAEQKCRRWETKKRRPAGKARKYGRVTLHSFG
eukprot:8917103-Pyramimonas_sp.AAC.1